MAAATHGARTTTSSLQAPGPALPMARTRKAYCASGVRPVTRMLAPREIFTWDAKLLTLCRSGRNHYCVIILTQLFDGEIASEFNVGEESESFGIGNLLKDL